MQTTLTQITNTLANQQNSQQKSNLLKEKTQLKKNNNIAFPFKRLVAISNTHFDFGYCVPGAIYDKFFTINLKEDLSEPITFFMRIICKDQKLNDLSEFVFAIKKDKEFEFTDFFQFRLKSKGKYDFVIGVKTPNFDGYHVKSQLKILTQFSNLANPNDFYSVQLEQKVCLPIIECSRELVSQIPSGQKGSFIPMRVLKFSQIKTKLKKEVKIPFKLQTDTKITISNELLGAMPQKNELEKNLFEIQPKQMSLMGKSVFLLSFKFGFTEEITKYLEDLKKKQKSDDEMVYYTLRRILVMRVNMTNIHFHYPIEVNFFLGGKKGEIALGE